LNLGENWLTALECPEDMTNLLALYLDDNRFAQAPSVSRLWRLQALDLGINQLSSFTVAHTLTNLQLLELRDNPLQTLVLPDVLATNGLAALVAALEAGGVVVHRYPVVPRLVELSVIGGKLHGILEGPPGIHQVQSTADLLSWTVTSTVTNELGNASVDAAMGAPFGAVRTALVYYE
jgi:Leucine-rich repeat (LRR) protein